MTSKSVDTAFKLFLYKIARNALIDFYRIEKRKKEGKHYDGSETIVTKLPDIDESKLSFNEKFKFQAIDQLPQKEKTVYLTYMMHEKDGVNLPRELRQSLKEYLGTDSQSTVRWYKKNATDKVNMSMRALIATQNRQNNE